MGFLSKMSDKQHLLAATVLPITLVAIVIAITQIMT